MAASGAVIDVGINRITDGEGNSRFVGCPYFEFKVWRNFSPRFLALAP